MARVQGLRVRTSAALFGALLCGGGCSPLDFADADTDTDAGTVTGFTSNTTDDGSGVTGLTADTLGDDGSGPGWETDSDPTDGEPESTCNLDCGPAGFCDDSSGTPTCACEAGFASTGLDCLPCSPVTDGVLPAVVPAVRTGFDFTVNGATPPQSPYDFGQLELRNRATGDLVPLGRTSAGSSTTLVVPGRYDVLYRLSEGGEGVPENRGAVIDTITVESDDQTFALDVRFVRYTGRITVGGSATASNVYNFGRLWLVNPTTGDRVQLGDTRDEQFAVNVVPGEYEIRYEVRENDGNVPANRDGLVGGIRLEGDTEADIDVPIAEYEGSISIDGASIASPYEWGLLELRDVTTGDVFALGQTNDEAFRIALLPGAYEVFYTSSEGGEQAPINMRARVHTFELFDDTQDAIDLKTARLSGSFSLAAETPPGSTSDDALVLLEDAFGGSALLGNTHEPAFDARILVGEYDVIYAQETASLSMPGNTHAVLGQLDVESDDTTQIDIPVTEVTGALTIGGDEAPNSPYDDGRLYLRNAQSGDSVLLGNTRLGTYAARVVPGTYDVVYENEFSDTLLPLNRGAIVRTGVEVSDEQSSLDIDIPVSVLTGEVEIDGSAPSLDEGLGQLFLVEQASRDEIFIGHTGAAAFTRPLTNGVYVMQYRGVAADGAALGTSLPANRQASFACFEVVAE